MSLFPFTREGRHTLVYIVFSCSGPALTGLILWALYSIEDFAGADAKERLDRFAELSMLVGSALLVTVVALACFVSIRAIKIGKDGIDAQGGPGDD